MSKYVWCNELFDSWIRDEIKILKSVGLTNVGTDSVTRLLVQRILIPNNIKIVDLLKPHIKINKIKNEEELWQ